MLERGTILRLFAGKNPGSPGILSPLYQEIILLGIWIIIQSALVLKNGIVTSQEAEKYITEARYFLENGNLSSANYWLYSTEVFLIAAAIKLHLSFGIVVAFQLFMNLWASRMFYKLALFVLNNRLLSFLSTFIFIINLPYQVYNSFLFTESIFYSLTIIYSSYLLRLYRLTPKILITLALLLLLLSITRPTGILFFGATAFYIFLRFLNHTSLWKKLLVIGSALLIFTGTINLMLHAGGSLDFMLPFKKENIICGVNTRNDIEIKTSDNGNSVQGIIYYISNNEKQFFRLAKLKTISFFGLCRNYYSLFHNMILKIFYYPFYCLALLGAWRMIVRKESSIFFMGAMILLYWITTLLTCDDWHNRFVLTVWPFIFLIAFSSFRSRFSRHKKI